MKVKLVNTCYAAGRVPSTWQTVTRGTVVAELWLLPSALSFSAYSSPFLTPWSGRRRSPAEPGTGCQLASLPAANGTMHTLATGSRAALSKDKCSLGARNCSPDWKEVQRRGNSNHCSPQIIFYCTVFADPSSFLFTRSWPTQLPAEKRISEML